MKVFLTLFIFLFHFVFPVNSQDNTNFRKNSIMVETNVIMMGSISYDRYISITKKASLIFGGEYIMGMGFGWGAHWIVPEIGILSFGPKHFFETGIQFALDIDPNKEDVEIYGREHSLGTRLAYRFQSKSGFNIRATINAFFNIDPIIIPTIGMGYSF